MSESRYQSGLRLFTLALGLAILIRTPVSLAKDDPHRVLLALSKADHTLALVDAHSLKVIARIPVGIDPHEVIASPDGKTAYVSVYGGGRLHEIDVIDLVAQKPLPIIDTRPLFGPHGLAFANGKLWFTAEGSKAIGEYDPSSSQLDWSMGTAQDRTHMIYVSDNGSPIFLTNVTSGTVSVLENKPVLYTGAQASSANSPGGVPISGWTQTVIPVTQGIEGFDVSPDGKELWTAAAGDGSIAVIALENKKVASSIDAKILGANRLKFTPDGKRALISSLRTGDLFIYDVDSRKEIKHLSLGRGAAGILVDADGTRAFVGCSADGYVAVVDLKKLEVVNHVDVGGTPDGLAWATIE
jgi:DNA-binding beta-propeller fold protein YncE